MEKNYKLMTFTSNKVMDIGKCTIMNFFGNLPRIGPEAQIKDKELYSFVDSVESVQHSFQNKKLFGIIARRRREHDLMISLNTHHRNYSIMSSDELFGHAHCIEEKVPETL